MTTTQKNEEIMTLDDVLDALTDLATKYPELRTQPLKICDQSDEEEDNLYVGSTGFDSFNSDKQHAILFYVV